MDSNKNIKARYEKCLDDLRKRSQEHILGWWADLDPGGREHLLSEIESVPWDILEPLIESHVHHRPASRSITNLGPPTVYPNVPDDQLSGLYRDADARGKELVFSGKVAAFTVAGGQGTRLGFDGPKGVVSISPVKEKSLFQLFAEIILAMRQRGADIRWYIMTNPANHNQTLGFLSDHDYYGIPREAVHLFSQNLLPSFDYSGKILMADKSHLALAPDGHGGSLNAMATSGALADMKSHNIEIISYFQIDNPLVKPFDPLFLGLHDITKSEMSTKVAKKTEALERVGNVCVQDGKTLVVEYSNFPEELATSLKPDGSRMFNYGNLAIHAINVDFVDKIVSQGFQLPFNRADKKVTYIDKNGFLRTPRDPNAVKLETFVFDAIPLAANPLVLEVERAEEFSPVKNAKGIDSVESAIRDQIRRSARWLVSAGAQIPMHDNGEPDVVIEIAPSFALSADDVKRKIRYSPRFDPGEEIYIA